MWDSSYFRKLQQFFWQCWRLCGSNFNETGLHHGTLLETFKENNLIKIGFLELVTKENLLGCFHQLKTY